jgi:hypothetical protein
MVTTVDPRHWSDARTAADRIAGGSASPDVIRAVLAQWICESGWDYPPKWNNPGNLAEEWAKPVGYPYTIGQPVIQPTNPIVRFADIPTGVAAYADGYLKIARYRDALARAQAGDGYGFVIEALKQGYGTTRDCFDSVNALLIARQPFDEDWGDTMFSTGGHIPQTDFRYPVSNTTRLYADPDLKKYVKTFSGTGGLARVIGPGKGIWDAPAWPSGIIIIGTAALDPKGTALYTEVDKAQLVDTRTAAASNRFDFSSQIIEEATEDRDTL